MNTTDQTGRQQIAPMDLPKHDQTICYRDVAGEMGGARVWSVRLPDGYLLECGNDPERAAAVAQSLRDGNIDGWHVK